MSSRPDALVVILVIAFFAFFIVGYFSQALGTLIGLIAYVGTISYAIYWALNIRRALATSIHRRQALGIGLVAALNLPDLIAHAVIGQLGYYLAYFVIEAIVLLGTFYFFDAFILAGRRSDPLLRDTWHWRRLREVVWPAIVFLELAVISVTAYFQFVVGTVSLSTATLLNQTSAAFYAILTLAVIAAIPIVASRSKDPLLRANLSWFAVYVGLSIVLTLFGNSVIGVPAAFSGIIIVACLLGMAYSLYRSARALAPLNKLSSG